jgi:STE24 endopeptidase
MALARWLGERWWIPGAAIFVALVAFFSWVAPILPGDDGDVDDPALEQRYALLAGAAGQADVPLRLQVVSGETSQANAFAWGIAGTREIVLWDTLLDGRFSDAEVDVVLAHELAHHAGDHLREAIAWFALLALPSAWLLMRLTRRRGGMGEAAAVPLALLVAAALQLALSPAQSAISRANEREADWRALEATRDPDAARALFVGFSEASLGDPSPPRWSTLLLSSHPTLEDRVRMAEAWRRAQAQGG